MDEYDPDNTNIKSKSGSKFDPENIVPVPIDDRRPLTIDNPKYSEKYKRNVANKVAMYMCPECKQLGCHRVTILDMAPGTAMGGEVCDVCGYEDTFEIGG